jgi:hypothetical protein
MALGKEARGQRLLREGLVAGVLGYATVVVYFVALNLIQGRSPFYTAALLGSNLFYGLESPADLTITAGPVIAYNGVHLLGFVVVGGIMAWLAGLAERIPQGWYLVSLLFLLVLAHGFGLPLWFDEPIRNELPLWHVVVATSIAAVVMGLYLLSAHPRLRASMSEYQDE